MPQSTTHPTPDALPPVIPLVRHRAERRAFDMASFDPARVGEARDLPPHLVLGVLDESSIEINKDGWSSMYRGCEPETWLRFAYDRARGGRYAIQICWRGIAGGFCQGQGTIPLARVVGQVLLPRFPSAWEEALPTAVCGLCHAFCVPLPPSLPTMVGVPDGPFRVVAFPAARGHLRAVRAQLAAVAAQQPPYPFAAEARLVTQTLHFDERMTSAWDTAEGPLRERSMVQTGIAPLSGLQPSSSRQLMTRAMRRAVYLVCVTVPWSGLLDLLTKLSGPDGPIVGAKAPAPACESTPMVLPPGLMEAGATVDVWLQGHSTGCVWGFEDPCGRVPAVAGTTDWRPEHGDELLREAEEAEAAAAVPASTPLPGPREIPAPRIEVPGSPRDILKADFPSVGELPIHGGWGYSVADAVVIDRNDPLVQNGAAFDGLSIERVFVEKRIYEELIVCRPTSDRYSGIRWKTTLQELKFHEGRPFDVLHVAVTALPDKDWEELKAAWEGPLGVRSPAFDKEAHLRKHESRTVRYATEYWFDVTSFFGRK